MAHSHNAGARGCVLKSDSDRDLANAVEALSHHKPFFTARVTEIFLATRGRGGRGADPVESVRNRLSMREREILQLLAEGKSAKEVAGLSALLKLTKSAYSASWGFPPYRAEMHALSYDLIDFLVLALPIAIAVASVLVGIKLAKGESHRFWWLTILIAGIGTSVLTGISQSHARSEHHAEIKEQRDAVEGLKIIIQTNEIKNAGELGYMKAKLEDSERLNQQYAPAIKQLAQTSADYMQKQYENKVISDKELYDLTMGVVKNIRDFSQKYAAMSRQQNNEMMASVRQAGTEAEGNQRWQKGTEDSIQLYEVRANEFRTRWVST